MNLSTLRPKSKYYVFDLVEAAGVDVADWILSSNDRRGHRANPKYCYEWSFTQPGALVVLNLWFDAMEVIDDTIVQKGNFRADAEGNSGKSIWFRRATKLDQTLQDALRENLPVRVIINDGKMRNKGDPDGEPSQVTARELDPEPWMISHYDWDTGEHTITRGILVRQYVDQFSLDQADKAFVEKRDVAGSAFVRDPAVRQAALNRANGDCEYCGSSGFKMANGSVYLETHHIVPLCEGGPDDLTNVAALCPNDHRRAHYGEDRLSIRQSLLSRASTE